MALGRGLGAILEEVEEAYANELATTDDIASSKLDEMVSEVDISLIEPNPYQPRKSFDKEKLKELSESIKKHGLLQPIVVISVDEKYILIAGERRLRAHKLAGMKQIKAIVADVDFDEIRMRELSLIENIQREDLNPIELAHSYKELIEVHNITHETLAKIVHKSRSQITNTMRLLSLSPYAQKALVDQKITQGHAKILVGLDSSKQKLIVDTINGQKLSVREAEQLVKNSKNAGKKVELANRNSFLIDKTAKELISKKLPFEHKVRKHTIEIVLPNEDELNKFIEFIAKR